VAAAAADGVCGLVSVQTAGNEVGQVMPLAAIAGALARIPVGRRPRLHTDAVQALGRLPLPFGGEGGGIDLATISAHKVGGPPGVGVLFRRRGIPLEPLHYGGEQEGGLRPGTESVAAIAAAGLAIELAVAEQALFAERAAELARGLWQGIHAAHPRAVLLGPPLEGGSSPRLPGTLNTLLPGVDGKVLVTRLDLAGLEVSAGSACASGSLEPSHVLLAMGLSRELARAGLRLSIGRSTTWRDVREAVEILRSVG
jgi:cysteine desulfurase